jgi:hypothetical protein
MQGLRKGEWSAITKVKVLSPEICLIALGQGFLHLEASSAARDKGEFVNDVPGSESTAGHSKIHSGTWEGHVDYLDENGLFHANTITLEKRRGYRPNDEDYHKLRCFAHTPRRQAAAGDSIHQIQDWTAHEEKLNSQE